MLEGIPQVQVDVWKKVKSPFEFCICAPCAKKIGILAAGAITATAIIYYFWSQQNMLREVKKICQDLSTNILNRLPANPLKVKREGSRTPEFDSDDEKGKEKSKAGPSRREAKDPNAMPPLGNIEDSDG